MSGVWLLIGGAGVLVVAGLVVAAVLVLQRATNDHDARVRVEERKTLQVVLDHQLAAAAGQPAPARPAAIEPARRRGQVRVLPPAVRLDREPDPELPSGVVMPGESAPAQDPPPWVRKAGW